MLQMMVTTMYPNDESSGDHNVVIFTRLLLLFSLHLHPTTRTPT